MTEQPTYGPITPANMPRLADLNDDTAPYPCQITVFCDECGDEVTADYLVPAGSTSADRLEIARKHLRRHGWSCSGAGDYCPNCGLMRTRYAIAEYAPILGDVYAERVRQITKFGEQHRKDGTGGPVMQHKADEARACCEYLAKHGGADWRAVLLEEVFEAMAEDDPVKLRAELVQSAAVCVAWVEDIDSRAGAPS